MEAKDTVIKLDTANKSLYIQMERILLEQAEISFNAGYEVGWNENKPYLPDANEPWDREETVFEDGKKAGIRELVEWFKVHSYNKVEDKITLLTFDYDDLQAKLKEWEVIK